MHIKRLEIKNWIGIKELFFNPGKINRVSGDSGEGKTSLVEALEKLFTNKNRRSEVIHHGENESELLVELDDGLLVDRKIRTEKSDYLKVKHDSKNVSSTEGFLRQLINGDIFRPVEFTQKSPDEQARIILEMIEIPWTDQDIQKWFGELPEGIDYQQHILQVLKAIEQAYFKERESINREVSLLTSNVEGIKRSLPANYDGAAWKEKNLQELYDKLSKANDLNEKIQRAKSVITQLDQSIENIKLKAEKEKDDLEGMLEWKRKEVQEELSSLRDDAEEAEKFIKDEPGRIATLTVQLEKEKQERIAAIEYEYREKIGAVTALEKDTTLRKERDLMEINREVHEKSSDFDQQEERIDARIKAVDTEVKHSIEIAEERAGNARAFLRENPEQVDVEPIRGEADKAAEMKEYLHEWQRMNEIIREQLAPKQERSKELTARITKARKLPQELLKLAALPIEGLSVDEHGRIRINDTLIDGLSEGENLDFALRLAKAQVGELKVICLDGWQNLGSKMQEKIMQEAKQDEYQYFILSTVQGPLSIEIEGE